MNKSILEKILDVAFRLSVVLFIGLAIYYGYQYFFGKEYGIIRQVSINNTNSTIYKDYYITKYNDKIMAFDLDGKEMFSHEGNIEDYEVFSEYVIVEEDKDYKLIDLNGKVKMKENLIQTMDKYLYVDGVFYNDSLEKLWEISFVDTYLSLGKYLVINCKDGHYLIDTKSNKLVDVFKSKDTKDNYTILYKNDSKVIIVNDKLYKDNIEKVNDKYFMDFSTCNGGATLNNEEGVVISDCLYDYEIVSDNVIIGYREDSNSLYINGNLVGTGDYTVEGKFVSGYVDDKFHVYELNGNKVNTKYGVSKKLKENLYIIEYNDSFYFASENLEIKGDSFSRYYCNEDAWCSITKKGKDTKNIYYNGREVSDKNFRSLSIYDEGYIVAKTLNNTYSFIIGEGKVIDISLLNDNLGKVNKEEVIEKYDLKDIEKVIDDNEELFLKYAYVVENNDALGNYKKHVMDMFRVVVDNIKYLDEYELLCGLKRLKIEVGETDEFTNGITYQADAKIVLAEATDEVLYHELFHFIDRYISSDYEDVYICDNKYMYESSVSDKSKCQVVEKGNNDFFAEAGAEVLSCKYFKLLPNSYLKSVRLYSLLEYVLGSDMMNDIFYSDNTENKFMMLILNNGYSYEEYLELDESLDHLSDAYYEGNLDNDLIKVFDFIMKLYKDKGKDFRTDNGFKFIIATLGYKIDFSSSKYYEEIKDYIYDYDGYTEYIDNIFKLITDGKYWARLIPADYAIINNDFYIFNEAYYYPDEVNKIAGNIFIKMDMSKLKVINYEFVETPSNN